MIQPAQLNIPEGAVEATAPAVLQVVPALDSGGAVRGAIDVAVAIAEAGGVSVVASEGGGMEVELLRAGVKSLHLPLASKNPAVIYRNIGRLRRVIREYGIEVVHARSRAPAWSSLYAAKKEGCRFVTTFHGTYRIENRFKQRYNSIMARGERVIAISDFIAHHILDHYDVDPGRIRTIPRGVDLARFDPAAVSAQRIISLVSRWRLPDGVPVIMLPGRLSRWKGQEVLLKALTLLDDMEYCCVLVGALRESSPYQDALQAFIKKHRLETRAFMAGACDDMPAAFMLADVVVSASTDPEAFGRVIAEGLAMGRPVVASDHGGAVEQTIDGTTAFLVPPNDPAALAAALREALNLTPSQRDLLATRAIEHIRHNFSKEIMCDATLGLYHELMTENLDHSDRLRAASSA